MTNDNIIGVALGSLVCAMVIVGNLVRADPDLVSVYPDVVSVAVTPLAVYLIGRQRRLDGVASESVQAFGVRAGAVAGTVFAAGLGMFTLYWLSAWPLLLFGCGLAFSSVFLLSCFAGYAAGRKRIIAVSDAGPRMVPATDGPFRSRQQRARSRNRNGRAHSFL
jgi:hypothetical protein